MTSFIQISDILIPPERQREIFDPLALNELGESIGACGLLQAVVLRQEADRMVLVAGQRRLIACKDRWDLGMGFRHGKEEVPPGMIPFVNFGQLTKLQQAELEFEENERRVNFNWQEKATATLKLQQLRSMQADAAGRTTPTLRALAEERKPTGTDVEVHSEVNSISRELLVANNLHDPDVQKAVSLKEAVKVLKKKAAARNAEMLGAALGNDAVLDGHRLVHGNCYEWMARQEAGQFDVVLTDPPYGMGADEFGDSGGKAEGEHLYADGAEVVEQCIELLPDLITRLTKPQAHLYLFCDVDWFPEWKLAIRSAGWKVFRTPFIWVKPSAYRAPWPEHGPQRKYECCLFAVKGGMRVTKLMGDVLTYQPDENLGHQAQKPVALFEDLLRRSIVPGMKALDPYCGSGPIFQAAQNCQVFATGVELNAVAHGIAAKRLQEMKGNRA